MANLNFSRTYDEAEDFYAVQKPHLLETIYKEFELTIDYQHGCDQVVVWGRGKMGRFAICYQNSDINGRGKGRAHWDNDGADTVFDDLPEILSQDPRFARLIAIDEAWSRIVLRQLTDDFCADFAQKNKIESHFECNRPSGRYAVSTTERGTDDVL